MIKVIIDYDSCNCTLDKIIVDGNIELDIDAIKSKQIFEWFVPSQGRDGWEGLLKEVHKAVADESVEIEWEFWGSKETNIIFEENLKKYGIIRIASDNRK